MKAIEKPAKCPDCTCQQSVETSDLESLDTAFYNLEPTGQNLIYSPLSIRYGLSLLNAGAAGNTKSQIENVLGEDILPAYTRTLAKTNSLETLSLANAVFIRDDFQDFVKSNYIDTVTKDYDAGIFYDDFQSTTNMDNWVKEKTFNLIDQIGVEVDATTEMVLANALAIQMDWAYQFDTTDTHGQDFIKEDDTTITATTMNLETKSDYIEYYLDDETTAIKLPLKLNDRETVALPDKDEPTLEFIAIMPSGKLSDFVKNPQATTDQVLGNLSKASDTEYGVKISIPKFKYEYELNFKSDLNKLGITDAFEPSTADFTNMTTHSDGLYVSDAIHKANIDFSENGIKAAAITVFAMKIGAAPSDDSQPIWLNFNRPFYYLIRDSKNDVTWFTGTMYEPNLWENDASSYQRH